MAYNDLKYICNIDIFSREFLRTLLLFLIPIQIVYFFTKEMRKSSPIDRNRIAYRRIGKFFVVEVGAFL